MDPKVNITATAVSGQPVEVILREGQVIDPKEVKQVVLSGPIGSPLSYALTYKPEVGKALCTYSTTRKQIVLICDKFAAEPDTVTGTLETHSLVKELGINSTNTSYNPMDLHKKLRLLGHLFNSRAEHASLLKSLSDFTAKTEIDFTQSDDFKGTKANIKIEKIKHDIQSSFEINIPLFVEEDTEKITVELEFAPQNGTIQVWLVSPQLAEMTERIAAEKIEHQIKGFISYGIVPIRIT